MEERRGVRWRRGKGVSGGEERGLGRGEEEKRGEGLGGSEEKG